MGAQSNILRLIYFRHVRSILEFGVPVWNGCLTLKDSAKIERVQKIAIHIIYSKTMSYRESCDKLKLEKLNVRRERLCLNFAKKAVTHDIFKDWFVPVPTVSSVKIEFVETKSRGKRLMNSPIPYLTRLPNKKHSV